MPIVVGQLRTIPEGLVGHIKSIGANLSLAQIQDTGCTS